MNEQVRRVLARYLEDNAVVSPDYDQDWMEYVERKTTPTESEDNPGRDMMKGVKELGQSFSTSNPYDYESPSDKPKDQKDSPPFESKVPLKIDHGFFMTPDMYGEQGDLQKWWESRRQDYTTDPDQQQPAISLVRKHANVNNVIAQYLFDNNPIHVPFGSIEEPDCGCGQIKTAATMREIINSDYHYKRNEKIQRNKGCSIEWQNRNNDKQRESGLFRFRVTCSDSKTNKGHTVFLQFLRPKDGTTRPKGYASYDVNLACSCLSFLYYGAQYYAVSNGYMFFPMMRPDMVAPRHQGQYTLHASEFYPKGRKYPGRGLNFRVCKHVLAVYDKFVQRAQIDVGWESYPTEGPPSKIMNREVWEKLMKFPLTLEALREVLRKGKVPAYFRRENVTDDINKWFYDFWIPRNESQKIKSMEKLSEYPERLLFILLKEGYLERDRGRNISERLIQAGFNVMDRMVKFENELPPQQINEQKQEVAERVDKGMGLSPTPGDIPAEQMIKEPYQPQRVPERTPEPEPEQPPPPPAAPTKPPVPPQPEEPEQEQPPELGRF